MREGWPRAALCGLLVAAACTAPARAGDPDYRPIPADAIKVPVPDVQQPDSYSCGAAVVMAVCAYYGVGPEEVADFKSKLHTSKKKGTSAKNMKRYMEKLGLKIEVHRDEDATAMRQLLTEHLSRGHPVILCLQAYADDSDVYDDPDSHEDGHYVVAIGFAGDDFFFMDPSLTGRRGWLSWSELDKRWHEDEGDARRKAKGKKEDVHRRLALVVLPEACEPAYARRARKID